MIALIDYGISNLRSVQKAFAHLGVEVTLIDTPDQLAQADRLILPGVGAFRAGMAGLRARDLIEPIKRAVAAGKPLIGICLGMQLLFESSDELGDTVGLGLLPGHVTKIKMQDAGGRMQDASHSSLVTRHSSLITNFPDQSSSRLQYLLFLLEMFEYLIEESIDKNTALLRTV
jgi:glutamine amidotransferase